MTTEVFKKGLRGTIVDLVQHHDWILIAASHSEGLNLGIQALSFSYGSHGALQIIECPSIIQSLVSLSSPNTKEKTKGIAVDGEELDPKMLSLAMHNRGLFTDAERTIHSLFYALIDEEGDMGAEISPREEKTLAYIRKEVLRGEEAWQTIETEIQTYRKNEAFRFHKMAGQQVFALGTDGLLYRLPQLDRADSVEDSILPQIWPESPQQIPNLPLIARMCVYNDQTLMCLLSEESRIVFIDVNTEEITHSLDVPQYQDPSLDQGDGVTRDVTAMTVDIDSGRFALGFDDGLYLFFDPQEGGFAQKTLYDVDRQVLTKLHSQPVTDLIFSRGRDGKEYLIAAASDLTMTVIGLAERVPKPKGKGRGPKKNIVQFLAAPTQYFYSISKDNQLYTWQSDVDYPSKTTVEWGPIALGLFPMENNRGELYYQDCLLVGRNDSDLDSAELGVYNITYTHRRTPDANLSIREEKQEGKLSGDLTLFVGAKQFATARLQGSLASRRSLIEWIGTWKDTLSVKLLERAIQEEENPALSTRALELLHATGHPTRALIYKNIIYDECDETASRIALDYLRSEELYGKENLFPLTFAFENNGYLQNKALRGFAELAQKRNSDPTNLIYQMAYEQVLSALGESDDDIVDAAFTFLFDGEAPLLPGIEGILLTLSHKEERIQKRGLETMYKKGMLQNPQTREAAKDLLRQVRDSSNENLRYRAFILSLTLEEGVQNYLRYIDPQVHTQLLDLEDEEYRAEYERFANHLELDSTVEAIFQDAISLDQDDRVVDWTEAERIIAAVQPSPDMPMRAYLTFIYCCQTFPMTVEIQERMLSTVQRSVFTPKPLDRDLTFTEEILLQEMSVSYQPEIASLGALALARLGRMQALPILLSLVDTDKALVRSRAVDGLLEFIHEPIVEQKLISMVLSARFVKRSKMGHGDKAFDIRAFVEDSNFRIRHSEARSIIQLIFRDDVYSQSERMAVRYIFESVDITFKGDTRSYLWNEITQKTAAPKAQNLRARIMHALFRTAEQRGIESVRSLIRQTQDSGFEDIRMMGVVRLQTHINATIAAEPDWKSKWTRLSEEDWNQDQLGAFVQAEDGSLLQKYRGIDPTAPLIGVPKQLLQDMQLLNRVFFWREHEAIVEVVKLYLKHNLIDGNFFRTRRFLLSLSEPKVFAVLLQELLDNVQDTYIQQDPNVHAWHTELWSDFLSQEDRDLALLAYEKLSEKLTGDPDRNQKDGESKKAYQHRIEERPHEEFLLCAYRSTHSKIQQKAISSAFNNQADMQQDWSGIVLELIERFWKIGKQGLKILEEKNRFREGILALLQHERSLNQSKKYSPFIKGMTLLLDDSRAKGMIDAEIAEIVAAKVTEWMQKDDQEILSQAESLLLDSRFFSQLPAAQAFGTDHQKRYYDLLKKLYVYQVPKDIADDVAAYKAHMQALTEKMEEIDQAIAQTDIGTLPAEEQEEARVTLQDRKHSLRLLQQEKNNAKEPTPYTDKRFYKVLSLLKDCTAGWVQEELDYFIFSMDEDVSNHAFDIYFVMGMGSHDPDRFLMSMLTDQHARLDDIFQLITSGKYDQTCDIKRILAHCTQLSRLDLVFLAFDRLKTLDGKTGNYISKEAWQALLRSDHPYLRLSGLHKKYITDAETIDDPVALINEPYPNPDAAYFTTEDLHRIFSPKPDKDGNIPPIEERNPHNLQEDDSVYIFVASSSAQTLSFTQKQFLTETFSLQLSHFRRLQGKQKRQMCLAVGASVKNAYTQLQRSAEQGVKLVVSKTHPSYREETLSLWWELIIAACETIYETHFLPDTAIFSDLLRIYDSKKYVPFFSAMSAVVGPEDIGTFAASVGHGYYYWRAVGYAGFPYSLQEMVTRHIRGETTYTSTLRQNFIACGAQSDPYFMRICSHPLDASEMRRHTLLWLLQKSAIGGSFDWISSMLGTQNEDMALGAAQILSQMSAPETFRAAIIAMVKNDKTKRDAFSPFEYQRQNPSQWMSIMQQPQEDSGKEKASQDQRYPTLEEYRAQKKHCQSLETKTKKTHAEYRKTSDPNRASQLWKEYKELDSKHQAERKAIEKLNAITHLSDEEWHQIIALLAVNNPRIRWRTAKLIDDFLDDTGRFHLLETIEKLQTIVSKHDMTTATFAAPTLNGKAFTKEEAVAFGFGALSSVLRHNRFSKENKSKALRAIVKLSCEERLPNIAAVLSVAFNDPSEEIRQESFHLALKHRDALGLTQQQIIQQASNAVAFRNAVADSAYRFSYDSLNHLILSELHISGQHEHILRMVSLETHYIARLALELLLKYRDQETREWTYVVPGLAAGLKARSSHVREMIVDAICDCLETKAHAVHKQSEEEREKALQPFWNLLHQALSHGNLDVQNEAASYLRRHKRTEVMPFVYRTYLESDSAHTQKMACRIIKDFKPTGATEKLFARMVNDPLVSANTSYITATIKTLNDHSMGFEEKLFEYLPGLLSGQKLSKIGYALLLHFSGIQTEPSQKAPDHTYRPSIAAKIMTFLLQHSQYQRLESCLSLLSQHMEHGDVGEQLASAELDRLLSQLATIRYREGTTDTLRMEALKACGARYISMTPALTSVPKDKQREMPDLAWSNHDWNALRTALDTNLSFHPVVEKKKEEKSPFQYESARILITCQGYIPYAFTVLRSILSLNQYSLSWRRNALSLLGPTYSLDLLPTLIELSGMDSRGNEIPANLHRVPEDLKQSAVQMLGYYHNTERSPHILTHLLRLWPKQNLRAQAQWALTNFISYPEYQEAIAALYLDETHAAKWSVRTRDKIEYNGRLHYPVQIFAYSLIELYQQLSQGETSAKRKHLRVSLAKQLEKRLYSSDINAVYAHSLRAREADDVALDIELYQNARAPFLTLANRKIMLQRIRTHADAEQFIELMRFALERAGTKTKVESYFEDNKLYGTQKELGFYHLNQIFRICSRDEESIELNMLCRMIQDEESQLSEITKKELSSRLHAHNFSRRGPYFPLYVSKNALFESSPVRWEDEVDTWESTIADTADSAEFYRSLLEKEVCASNGLFASLLDILAQKELSDQDKLTILGTIRNIRLQWTEHKKEQALGISGLTDPLNMLEKSWEKALGLVSVLQAGTEELVYLLSKQTHWIPIKLQQRALDLYLDIAKDTLDQKILEELFARENRLQSTILPHLKMHAIRTLMIECESLPLFQNMLYSWKTKVEGLLTQETIDTASWMLLTDAGEDLPTDALLRELRAKILGGTSEIEPHWKALIRSKAKKEQIMEELLFVISLEILQTKRSVISSSLASFYDGRPLAKAVQVLENRLAKQKEQYTEEQRLIVEAFEAKATEEERASKVWPKKTFAPLYSKNVLSALAYSQDSTVKEITSALLTSKERTRAQKHRLRINNLEKSRSSRFSQELQP